MDWLPSELHQIIFDHVGTRAVRSLLPYRLVSKSWLEITKKLLVDFRVEVVPLRTLRAIVGSVFPRIHTLRLPECFKAHLSSWPYLSTLRYLRFLCVSCVHTADLRVIANVTQLESLKISFSTLSDSSFGYLTKLQNLTSLKLTSCMLPPTLHLHAFHNLEVLCLKRILNRNLTSKWLLCLRSVPTLRFLQICGVDNYHTSVDEALLELVHEAEDRPLFTALESLDLSKTGISGRALNVLARHLTGLRSLDIGRTHVTGDDLLALGGLIQLRSLSLESLLLNTESFKIFSYVSNLRCLDLTDTHIAVRSISLLAPLRRLQILHLCPTSFKFREGPIDEHLQVLRNLTALQLLNLTGAQIEGPGLENLTGLTRLETLFLYQTTITARSLSHLANLRRVHTLELGNCAHLDAEVVTYLPLIDSLRSLDLSWLQIPCPGPLKSFRYLETLDLSYNTELTSRGLEQVTSLRSLKTLNLWYCPKLWSLECFLPLRAMKSLRCINIEHWKHVHVRRHLPQCVLTDSL